MTNVSLSTADDAPLSRADPLALLRVPFVFSQDGLIGTEDVLKQAKERGHDLSLDSLHNLHEAGLFTPLFRVDDEAKVDLRINVPLVSAINPWGWTSEAARDGRLRDPQCEGAASVSPYQCPADVAWKEGSYWWNGYTYSPWQLIDLHNIINERKILKAGWQAGPDLRRIERKRRRTYALAALSPRFLPGILGRVTLPPGTEADKLWQFRHESNALELLQMVGFDPADLRSEAEGLLHDANRRDPLTKWLPLIRHASYEG